MKDAAMDTTNTTAASATSTTTTTNWTTTTSTMTTTTTSEQNSALERGSAGYLNADQTLALMADLKFSPDQWSELGGWAIAEAVHRIVTEAMPSCSVPNELSSVHSECVINNQPRVLFLCGTGIHGGMGLVAARHAFHFGFDCTVIRPQPSSTVPPCDNYIKLQRQCQELGIVVREDLPESFTNYRMPDHLHCAAVVDAMLELTTYSEPLLHEPYVTMLQALTQFQKNSKKTTVLAVDVPFGWHMDQGDVWGTNYQPDVLLSLMAPKSCARQFTGRGQHWMGGRWVPPSLAQKYGIRIPPYPGTQQVMPVALVQSKPCYEGWEAAYAAYLAEQEESNDVAEKESEVDAEANASNNEETNFLDNEPWEVQYAAYLAEKEAQEFAR